MDAILADVRYGLRLFRKSPVFSLVAGATLALGIGANSVIFSVVDAVVIRALPYDDPDRVIVIWEDASRAGFPRNTPAPANYIDWRRLNRSFVDMAATRGATASVTGDGVPEQIIGRRATANFFSVLGVRPFIGRTFTEAEDRDGAQVAVISYGLWQRRYGGDPSIVGRTTLFNDVRYEIIGVMPRPFAFRNREVDYWIPNNFGPDAAANRGSHFLNVVGRLKPDVSLEAARADMQAIARRLTEQYPDSNRQLGIVLVPAKEEMVGNTRLQLLVLMGAAAAVLLIACANLASLLLSRAAGRRGEMAVRAALGASRRRLARQLVVEGLLLSLLGGALGLALVPIGSGLLTSLTPIGIAKIDASTPDVRLVAFTFAVAIATGLLFSIAPALHAGRTSLQQALQQQARSAVGAGSRFTRDGLVVLQIAAAVVLLVATGLMIRTLLNLRAIDIGFEPDRLLTMRTTLPRPKYAEAQKRVAFYERVIAGVKALPGVERVAFASDLPFTTRGNTTWFGIEGQPMTPDRVNDALFRGATTDYLSTLGVRLVEGRLIDERDGVGAPRAVVINETLARQFFSNESPIGHRMQFITSKNPFHTIVGVVRDVRERGYEASMKPGVYFSTAQAPEAWAVPEYLVVRARRPSPVGFRPIKRDANGLADAVRRVIADADPAQPVAAVRSMDDILDLEVADRHQQMVLLGAFATLALVLASLGLYGLLAYAVAQRSREIGLRIALGATPRAVVRMVAARGLGLTAVGLGSGVAAGWAATRAMSGVLYRVPPTDAATFGGVIVLLGTVALIACIVPAARAANVDPMIVLREQ
jgi:putative ABC transport system permease protein